MEYYMDDSKQGNFVTEKHVDFSFFSVCCFKQTLNVPECLLS
jgi:hypothetical protein